MTRGRNPGGPPKHDNPWVKAQCEAHGVLPNGLPTHLPEHYAQLGEDLVLEGLLRTVFTELQLSLSDIRYLEVGANHPIQTSNTYLFSKKWGGCGVLVEANPDLIEPLRRVRPRDRVVHAAVVPVVEEPTVRLHVGVHSELSSLDAGHMRSFGKIGQEAHTVEVPAVSLDEVLLAHFDSPPHLLSLDIEGVDLEVLKRSRLVRRPLLILVEPSGHYHVGVEDEFAQEMQAKGYVELARTEYNLVYGDRLALARLREAGGPAQLQSGLPRSFDLFDTLFARRCIRPDEVFHEMERRTGAKGLAQLRHAAERAVEGTEYSLQDIYREFARLGGIELSVAEALMRLEVAVELENVVPIADHIALLQSDSLLISDMYLPTDVIRRMLALAGVPAHLNLLRTSHGKREGSVWRALAQAGRRYHHLGDHPVSDVAQALAAGMQAELTQVAQPSVLEQGLIAAGAPRLAEALRAARLRTPRGALSPALHRLQVQLNLPMLLISALHLLCASQTAGVTRVLFASRDGRHLQTVFDAAARKLTVTPVESVYWYTSRLARSEGGAAYLDYCRSVMQSGTLLVDLCGTGASVAALRHQLGMPQHLLPLFVCERIESPAMTAELAQRYGVPEVPPPLALWTNETLVPNELLELLNYVPEGMVRRVEPCPGGWLVTREPVEFQVEMRDMVEAQAQFIADWAQSIQIELRDDVLTEVRSHLPAICATLGQSAPALIDEIKQVFADWLPAHRAHEAATQPARTSAPVQA